jgi:hypothetical protein
MEKNFCRKNYFKKGNNYIKVILKFDLSKTRFASSLIDENMSALNDRRLIVNILFLE